MFQQRSLFPAAFEVQEEALRALRGLDAGRALALVARARRIDPRLVNLDPLEEALRWLRDRTGSRTPAELAAVLRAVGEDGITGRLTASAAAFVDTAVARFVADLGDPGRPFLDGDERVPRALIDLILGRAEEARAMLVACLSRRARRADLWGWLGDACVAVGRADEASACYVRALVRSAGDLDLHRLREGRLRICFTELRRQHDEAAARELLLPQAWLAGVLAIPVGNGWLAPEEVRQLLDAARTGPGEEAARRLRRFKLLMYVDRSRAPVAVDLGEREEMAALLPELFASYLAECRRREG